MKRILLILFLISIFILTGCNNNEAKKEAKQKINHYSNSFEQQIKELYGENAKLENIECQIYSGAGSSVPLISYWASDSLSADLILNNKTYRAELNTETGVISTDIYYTDIIDEFIGFFPIDSAKITYIVSDHEGKTTFDSSIKNLSDAIKSPSHLNIYIITTENLTNIKEEDFLDSPIINELKDTKKSFSLHIFSISNTEKLEDLKKRIKSIRIDKNIDNNTKELFDYNSTDGDTSGLNITNLIEFKQSYENFYYDTYSNN